MASTPLLDGIVIPDDLKRLDEGQLIDLARELRSELIRRRLRYGRPFRRKPWRVELTVALHYVFNAPVDRIIWDVSHQAYPHKILTGRRDRIRTIAKAAACPVSPSARKASTTRSARRIPRRRSPPVSAWPWRAISRAAATM